MNWIIILLVIAILVIVSKFIHFNALKHKIIVVVLVVLGFFFVMTFISVAGSSSVSLKSASGLFQAGKVYFSWLGHVFDNFSVLTGNAVRMDWFSNMSAKI